MTLLITDAECENLIDMDAAISAVEAAFRMAGEGDVSNPPRFRMQTQGGREIQFGLAALHGSGVVGFKMGSPRTQRWNFLYDMKADDLVAIVQARHLSRLRTGAASAVAVKHLSPPSASVVGMYGTGRQAEAQLEAICRVRPIRRAQVYSRRAAACEAFARRMAERLRIEVRALTRAQDVPVNADIIVTMTNSVTPVLRGEWIARPCLVLGVGANHMFDREVDDTLVNNAALVVVDEMQTARAESGDLLPAASRGTLRWEHVVELGAVVAGRCVLPDSSAGVILFESHGLGLEDVAVAMRVYELARARNLGREISI